MSRSGDLAGDRPRGEWRLRGAFSRYQVFLCTLVCLQLELHGQREVTGVNVGLNLCRDIAHLQVDQVRAIEVRDKSRARLLRSGKQALSESVLGIIVLDMVEAEEAMVSSFRGLWNVGLTVLGREERRGESSRRRQTIFLLLVHRQRSFEAGVGGVVMVCKTQPCRRL